MSRQGPATALINEPQADEGNWGLAARSACVCSWEVHRLWFTEPPCMLLSSALPNYAPALSAGVGSEPPVGSLGQMLNQVTAAIPAATAAGSNGQNPVMALPGSLASHKAQIAHLRTSIWVYLTPLLGMLYILSPLDIIPDFIPLVGWIDDGEREGGMVVGVVTVVRPCSTFVTS